MQKLMKQNGMSGERIFVKSATGNIWSNKFGLISENGRHDAIKIDDIIFDNLNYKGVNYDKWLYDLGIKEQPSILSVDPKPIN